MSSSRDFLPDGCLLVDAGKRGSAVGEVWVSERQSRWVRDVRAYERTGRLGRQDGSARRLT